MPLASVRAWVMSRVPRESAAWRAMRAGYAPLSWTIGTLYAHTQRRFTEQGVVIGGAARSGTTLLLAVLSAHPRILAIDHETYAFCPDAEPGPEPRFSLHRLYTPLALASAPPSTRRWCEKTPRNVRVFGAILDLLGDEARLVHVVRDGRDVVTSSHPRRPAAYYTGPRRWLADVRCGLQLSDPRIITVRYEDVVRDFEPTVNRVLGFLGEDVDLYPFDGWHAHATLRRHTALPSDLQPIFGSSIGRWRRPEHAERLRQFMSTPGAPEMLERLGYTD